MKRVTLMAAACVAAALSGCATKRYGRMTELSGMEGEEYSCHEVRLEQAKVEAFRLQVANGAKIDWRSVAGFMGDYGIGNAMEKSDAERSATKRMNQLNDLYAKKDCEHQPPSAPIGIVKFLGDLFTDGAFEP